VQKVRWRPRVPPTRGSPLFLPCEAYAVMPPGCQDSENHGERNFMTQQQPSRLRTNAPVATSPVQGRNGHLQPAGNSTVKSAHQAGGARPNPHPASRRRSARRRIAAAVAARWHEPSRRLWYKTLEELRRIARDAKFDPDAFAMGCGVRPRTFQRRFHDLMNCSPSRWLEDERMRLAPRMLKRAETVKQVYSELGFTSRQAFCRMFHKYYNRTPTQQITRFMARRSPSWRSG
jgi:AraC-like DNA-binding protein